jgi:hypothetical protein
LNNTLNDSVALNNGCIVIHTQVRNSQFNTVSDSCLDYIDVIESICLQETALLESVSVVSNNNKHYLHYVHFFAFCLPKTFCVCGIA